MKSYAVKDIRNVAVIGHSGEGKTSLCEAILYNMKMTDRLGKTAEGNTVMDFDEQEIARKISISLSLAYGEWKDCKINLIDVPGFYDFEGEMVSALQVADSAIIVTGSSGVLSVGTDRAVKYCEKYNIPMLIFINGIDKDNADYFATLEAIREKYPRRTAPIQLPIMEGSKMRGYVSALSGNAYRFTDNGPVVTDIPADITENLSKVYAHLMESAAENDDALLEKFFEQGTLDKAEVVKGIKKGIRTGAIIPIMSGSALLNKGVFNLMDRIVSVLPSPDEMPAQVGDSMVVADKDAKVIAQVFKTIVDPFVGRLNLIKVISGTLKSGDTVRNLSSGGEERISSLYALRGKKQEAVDQITAGDIGAVSKLSATCTGDTLAVNLTDIMPKLEFPAPAFEVAIYAQKSGEEDKIFSGLYKLVDEDKTIQLTKNAETGEMILGGLGETHIDIIISKLKAKFKVEAAVKKPKIAYRETIKNIVSGIEGKHKKQSGGHGQYGHVKMRFEPIKDEYEFAEEVVGGSVPKQYIPAVEKGIRENLPSGVLAGYPVIGLRAVLTDGSYHDVDSSEMAFKLAASIAFKEGLMKANPVLLEPIYAYSIAVPENYTGDIMGDINKRRGKILGMDSEQDVQVVHAEVPQCEMFKYATDLRSMTQGRGSFTKAFCRYDTVPEPNATKIIEKANKERETK